MPLHYAPPRVCICWKNKKSELKQRNTVGHFKINRLKLLYAEHNSRITCSVKLKTKTPWPETASELYRPSDCLLSAKLKPTFFYKDRGCRMVSATHPYGRILGFLDRSRYFFFQPAPQLYSRGWLDPVPDPLLLRKSGSARYANIYKHEKTGSTNCYEISYLFSKRRKLFSQYKIKSWQLVHSNEQLQM
jgi:hypothetical protein